MSAQLSWDGFVVLHTTAHSVHTVCVYFGVFCRSGEGVIGEIRKVLWVNRCSVAAFFGGKTKA